MADAAATMAELEIFDLEKALVDELTGVSLVGEIDLDVWGPLAEEGLTQVIGTRALDRIRRLWPATFVTYLVYQGIHQYEDSTFWPNVTLPKLRRGNEVGPEFETALQRLHLPTFDDLEENEGFRKETRNRYVRRIHLHGGLPRASTLRVYELLAATLRSGARSASEVVGLWSSMELDDALRNKAAVRLFAYTGDFGVHLVDQLIQLLRAAERSGDLRIEGVPSHLIDGALEYMEVRDQAASSFNFVVGPRIQLDVARFGPPMLVVPPAGLVEWTVGGQLVGTSSRQVEQRFALGPAAQGTVWIVDNDEGGKRPPRRYVSESIETPLYVFDERGRLHQRGTTLGGVQAHVLAPTGTQISTAFDEHSPGARWPDHTVLTCDLRGQQALVIEPPDASPIKIAVESRLDVRLAGDLVDGVSTRGGGLPVYADAVRLAFAGFVPDPAAVTVTIDGEALPLARCEVIDGEFDLSPYLARNGSPETTVTVSREAVAPVTLTFARLPGLRVRRPRIAAAHGEVTATIEDIGSESARRAKLTFADEQTVKRIDLAWRGLKHPLAVELNRISWAVEGPHTVVPIVDGERFVLRVDELRDTKLHLRTNGVAVKVLLLDADRVHEEWARRDRAHVGMATVAIRGFADTARSSSNARTRLAAIIDAGQDALDLGIIESRYEPWNLAITHLRAGDEMLIEAKWSELQPWPNRVVRLWAEGSEAPLLTVPVEDGATGADLLVADAAHGRFLVEVVADSGWGAPRYPAVGPGCVSVYLGAPEAERLRASVLAGDRRARFTDEDLDQLVPLLADLVLELMQQPEATTARTALIERIADDQWRAVEVLTELADRFEVGLNGEGREQLEPFLIELLPVLFDFPIRETTPQQAARLEHLWVIAPLAAACIDAVRNDSECNRRWMDATGRSTAVPKDITHALERLVQMPKDIYVRSQLSVFDKAQYAATPEKPKLLQQEAWAIAIRQLDEAQGTVSLKRAKANFEHLVRQLERRASDGSYPIWGAVVRRVRAGVEPFGPGAEAMGTIVALACAHLDPASARRADDVLAALQTIYRVHPDSARCALLLAAASLRTLEGAGSLAKLVT